MTRPSIRPLAIGILLLAVLTAGGYLTYELGRHQGGYAMFDVRRELSEYQRRLEERDQAVAQLERQVAMLETSRGIDRATYAQVEADLAEQQARIQVQQEELEFYRGIVSPEDAAAGLRVQSAEVSSLDREGGYLVKLVLVQTIVHTNEVAGVMAFRVAGSVDGEEVEYAIQDLAAGVAADGLPYGFRYFQGLDVRIRLPGGFDAQRLIVELSPAEPRAERVTHEFLWSDIIT